MIKQELVESGSDVMASFDLASDPVLILHFDGEVHAIRSRNLSASRLFGESESSLEEILPPSALHAFLREEVFEVQGEDRLCHYQARLSTLPNNRQLAIVRDVTSLALKIKEVEDDLQTYLYTISHDFKAPLRGMLMSAMILLEDYEQAIDAGGQTELRRQSTAAKKLAALMEEILKLSRVGTAPFARMELDLSALAQEAIESLGASESISIEPDLMATGDTNLTRALLGHLLSNALKFHPANQVPSVTVGKIGEEFFVQDNGIGMAEEQVSRAIRVFERINGDQYPGLGTGLTQAKRIVERHGGSLRIESKEGVGTTVYFTLG